MASKSHTTVPPLYTPAPYLITSPTSFLTREQLIQYFGDFYASLEYVNTAPHLVFERLISNLSVPVCSAIDEARRDGARNAATGDKLPGGGPVPVYEKNKVLPSTKHLIRSLHMDDKFNGKCTNAVPSASTSDSSRIALALTSFHMCQTNCHIVPASTASPHTSESSIRISDCSKISLGNPDSRFSGVFAGDLLNASCSWLELDASDSDLQCGETRVFDFLDRSHTQLSTTYNITFPHAYDEPPQVLVWLKYLGPDSGMDPSIRLVASNITAVGFTLLVKTPMEAYEVDGGITWLACSTGRPDVWFGKFQAEDRERDRMMCKGNVSFQTGLFKSTPRVIVGISGFHTDRARKLCIAVEAVEVASEGMKWQVAGMGNRDIDSVECSFIVLA